jgi:hypothetical protein
MPVVVGAVVVALLAVGGLITALALKSGGGSEDGGDQAKNSPSPSETAVSGHKGPDKTKTIDTTECTEPKTGYNDETKIQVPDFQYKYIDSVKSCLKAAAWRYEVKYVDENTFGQGSVIEQWPEAGTEVDEKNPGTITLSVSSGNPA